MHIKVQLYFGPLHLILTVGTVKDYVLEAIEQETRKKTTTVELLSWK